MGKKESLLEINQLALMDHAGRENHTTDWDNKTLPVKEEDWTKSGIMEVTSFSQCSTMTPSVVT